MSTFNDVGVSFLLSYLDSLGITNFLQIQAVTDAIATEQFYHGIQSISNSADTTINLGAVATPGWFVGVNRDATNYLDLKTAASGTIFAHLKAGLGCLLYLGSGALAPAGRANTAACNLEYLVIAQ